MSTPAKVIGFVTCLVATLVLSFAVGRLVGSDAPGTDRPHRGGHGTQTVVTHGG